MEDRARFDYLLDEPLPGPAAGGRPAPAASPPVGAADLAADTESLKSMAAWASGVGRGKG